MGATCVHKANSACHILIWIPSSPHGNLFGLSCNAWWEVLPLSYHPWLFYFILCAASYFILSTSSPSLHRYYRHAKAGWEGHYDLCFMLLPRLLRCAEGETLLLTTPSFFGSLPSKFLRNYPDPLKIWNPVLAFLPRAIKSFLIFSFLEGKRLLPLLSQPCQNYTDPIYVWRYSLVLLFPTWWWLLETQTLGSLIKH